MYISELKVIMYQVSLGNNNPVDYLNFFFKIASVFYHILFTILIWLRGEKLLEAVNAVYESRNDFINLRRKVR
jgi:hypothetical protein